MKTVFVNGNVYTLDRRLPKVQALIVEGGKIIFAGKSGDAKKLKRRGDEIFDLKGHAVIPGLVDCHVHLVYWAETRSRLALDNALSVSEIQKKVAAFKKRIPKGGWLFGRGFDKNLWPAGEMVDKKALDAVCQDIPIILTSKDEHCLWLNSAALTEVGICSSTSDPAGGRMVRYENSQKPTGYLLETACHLVYEYLDHEQKKPNMEKIVRSAQKEAWKNGVTGVHALPDPGFEKSFALLEWMTREEKLKLRVLMYIPEKRLEWAMELGLQSGFGNDFFKIGGVKIFADGTLGSQTALLFEPYAGSSNTGVEVASQEHLQKQVKKAAEAGLACAIHAIGDKAASYALESFGKALPIHNGKLRQRIEHIQLLRNEDLPKFRKYRVAASMQPVHATSDRQIADKYWGARCQNAYPWRSLLKSGALLAFGSDAPIEPLEPLAGIYAAVCRKKPSEEKSWFPEQKISVSEAIRAYTVNPAVLSGDEKRRGTLSVGKLADFVVLSEDPFKIAPEKLSSLEALATVVGGEVVYSAASAQLG